MSNYVQKVAIIGAGGNIGKHITQELLKTGNHIVTAISRPSSNSTLPNGVKVACVDYTSEDDTELVQALTGQQALIVSLSVAARGAAINIIRAAAKAKVQYLFPNWFGHDAENDALCRDSFVAGMRDDICSEIKKLGVSSYFLLGCGFWYEWSLSGGPDRYGFDFKERKLVLFDGGEVHINTSTWPQCGRAIAALLSLKIAPEGENDDSVTLTQFCNRSVYISSFRVTQRDIFESVKRVTGTSEKDWVIMEDSAKKRWEEAAGELKKGNSAAFTKFMYSRMWFPTGDGDHETTRGLHNDLLGLPQEDLDEFTSIAVRMGENSEVPFSH
ncbi:putative oxidoreductase CipA-like protein [Periconia macrospinosa]|uniref:Putative oxidoreductase CipA-like protein n=1 Tax=Periconia macrospinosa TaxID=97972 RepID=A0A2V1DXI1_9PLEO|nr:putative oxidoreductase CipA-like protein [Periconia macrospinosa]